MIKLSIIIVNYNVKHFLEQCLHSVTKAVSKTDSEIFVVDNNSVDTSCNMVRDKFPEVKLISNDKNLGFSKANNQAIKEAKGKYVLLLNPDTVVEEDSFEKIIRFMDKNDDVGGLGVKMIDGKGKFLPESKRGLPTPEVAFYKIFGLSSLFPYSKKFGKYHLSYLDKHKIHEVDILSGAFMFLRKEAIDKTGYLDEEFFMYGEDIDLSYRIQKAGYKNIYFPETTIIHYKGESTKKGSINYVRIFYQAMIIFAEKHFSQKNAKLYSSIINSAIIFRAALAIFVRFLKRLFVLILDSIVIYLGFYILTPIWEMYKFNQQDYYPESFLKIVVPAYILIWLITVFLSGGYDKPTKFWKLIRGLVSGSILILLAYSLLPESFRYSRALILLGSAWTLISIPVLRIIGTGVSLPGFNLYSNKRKRLVILGSKSEIKRVHQLLDESNINAETIGYVNPLDTETDSYYLGNYKQIKEIVNIHKADEIIFCARDFQSQKIISTMLSLSGEKINYKIASPDGISVIGSNSINTAGDLYTLQINTINTADNKRKKRILDVGFSLLIILFLPVFMIISGSFKGLLKNVIMVLFGIKSWVGYAESDNDDHRIPVIKKGVVSPSCTIKKREVSSNEKSRLNLNYARDYKIKHDLQIIIKSLRCLGN